MKKQTGLPVCFFIRIILKKGDGAVEKRREKWINCILLVACLAAYWAFEIPCPVMALFDIPCPGCGMTRALKCLLRGDIAGSFAMNPMLWSIPVLLVYYLKDGQLFSRKWANNGLLILIGAGFLANWIYRLVLLIP